MTLLIKGVDVAAQGIRAAGAAAVREYRKANRHKLEKLRTAAVEQAPWRTGDLRASAFVETEDVPEGLNGVVGFRAPHAFVVHQNVRKARFAVGKDHFLEDPLKDAIPDWDKEVAEAVNKALAIALRGRDSKGRYTGGR